jgi:hypothetical protein
MTAASLCCCMQSAEGAAVCKLEDRTAQQQLLLNAPDAHVAVGRDDCSIVHDINSWMFSCCYLDCSTALQKITSI